VSFSTKVVVKNNIPVCVMISPQAYDEMAVQLKEARLLLNAKDGKGGLTTINKIMDKFGITEEDLDSVEDDEIV
jgi:antitoxin StbD